MKLFLCEKPSQGNDIAKVLGATKFGDGYLSRADGSVVVTWAVGHLVEQFSPEQYNPDYKQWRFDALPIIPKQWGVSAKANVKKQYNVVMALIKKASVVVISTDADREGEMIARELLDLARYKGNIQRLWLSALDAESIKKALSSIKDGRETESLYYAALARSRSDWLIGMNFSRLFTLLAQQQGYMGKPLSVGRVQSPTLAIVVNRDKEIKHFIPKDHYTLIVRLTSSHGLPFTAHYVIPETARDTDGLCLNAAIIQKAAKDINTLGSAQIINIETKREKNAPPLLFALSDLQFECNRLFGMGAQQVLDIAQSLYETHKLTTYPRTDCGYLPEAQLAEVPNVIQGLVNTDLSLKGIVAKLNLTQKSKAWNDKKITAHHGIIPTIKGGDIAKLSSYEMKVYDLIRRRYLAQFLPHFEVDKTTVQLQSGAHSLISKGKVIVVTGWQALFQGAEKDENDESNDGQKLPNLSNGESCPVADTDVRSLKTSPPSHFTEGTLLSAMKNAARFVTDEQLKQRLRETEGLGTEATRAGLIQGLIDKGFLTKKGKQLLATAQAVSLIDSLPNLLKDPGLTALWEQALNQIAERSMTLNEFMSKQEIFVRQLMDVCMKQGIKMGNIETKKCPKCGSPMAKRQSKTGAVFWGCTQYPNCDGVEFIDSGKKRKTRKSSSTISYKKRILK